LVLWFTMIWGAGLRWKHMGYLAIIAVAAMPVLWSRMDEYQQERITTFISPSEDDPSFYNIRQAIVSIGSGGLGGKGYMQGSQTQARFLRVRHTDFIFAVLAEEFGFVGGIGVIALLGVVLARIVRAARTAADPLGSLLCYGVASFIFFQTFVSIGMNLQLVPVTGLTLPFVSSGGTSLLSTLAGIGLVQSVVIRRKAM
jgi:rod shape determining protein RodA